MDAIYARQSIDKKDSISIEGQIDLCRKECNEEPKIFQDKGYSGKNIDRPAFKALMQAVESAEISRVIVYRLDRISRSINDFGRIWDMLNKNHVEFISVNEKFDTSSPVGRAMIYIIMVFAQLERETIAERVKDNYHQRAKRGAFLGGPAPFGFDIIKTTIEGKIASMLTPNENIQIVRDMFEKYAYTGMSLGKIAEWLVKENIPGIQRKTWDSVSISRILHNPLYVKANADVYFFYKTKGLIMYNEVEEFVGVKGLWLFGKRDRNLNKYTNLGEHLVAVAHHDGIISANTFLACQKKLDSNKQVKNSGTGQYSWLTGLVKCGYCGYSMRVINSDGGKYIFFNCTGKSNLKICTAKHKDVHVSDIEPFVAEYIQNKLVELREHPIEIKQDDNNLKSELLSVEGKISNLLDSIEDVGITSATYINERILKLDERKKQILKEMSDNKVSQTIQVPNDDFNNLSFEKKKEIARLLIKKVSLVNDKPPIIEPAV